MNEDDVDRWGRTFQVFRHIAAREGVRNVACEIPASYVTVYRLIRGDTVRPTRAVRAGIERIVRDYRKP